MDHLLSKEPKRGICLVLSVLGEYSKKIIENWIIKKTFLRKRKDKMKKMRLEKKKSRLIHLVVR